MEEKGKYVVYANIDNETIERIVTITEAQAFAIDWFIQKFNIDGCIETIENYEGEEI